MQILKLFVYDELILKENIRKISKNIKVLDSEYAVTFGHVRYIDKRYNFFTNQCKNFIFGKLITLYLSEEDLILLKMSRFYDELIETEVKVLKDVVNLYTCEYLIKESARASIFISKLDYIKKERHKKVGNFTKYLLLEGGH